MRLQLSKNLVIRRHRPVELMEVEATDYSVQNGGDSLSIYPKCILLAEINGTLRRPNINFLDTRG
ncbi:MAG TPA: hypothetical protein VKM72_04565 [Thermoanaerobaculia bacterium]|nr:hypothetical protein [Thermoanaerobaculia bacterium]